MPPANAPTATILFVQASPRNLEELDIATEQRNLAAALRRSLKRDAFDWRPLPAAQIGDLGQGLREHTPAILHFAGHGNSDGSLHLNAASGETSEEVDPEDFANVVRAYQTEASWPLRLAVLAGCFTERAAELLSRFVDCTVGMEGAVQDEAMVQVFTPSLYAALADGRSVANAVQIARADLRSQNYGYESEQVKLHAHQGVDPRSVKLTDLPTALSGWHLQYLQRLFEQKWSSVSMALFEPTLGRRVRLVDIYTPLPVDFTISRRIDKQGREADWWCGRGAVDDRKAEEVEALQRDLWESMQPRPRLAGEHALERQRTWSELNLDESDLQPLLELARGAGDGQKRSRDGEERVVHWRPDAEHAALVQPRFVLVGDPGSGKSTFLRHLALCWAGELRRRAGDDNIPPTAGLHNLPGWTRAYTPIYIELRSLVGSFAALPADPDRKADLPALAELRAYLASALPSLHDPALVDVLFDLLRQGRAALLLDGLDEVSQAADPRRRAQLQAFAGELAKEFPQAPILVTARPYAYRQGEWALPGFGRTELAPLDPDRQAELAQRLFAALLDAQAEGQTRVFTTALEQIPEDLRSNPLLLTLLAALWLRKPPQEKDLPSTRGELYRRALKLLLEDWVREKGREFLELTYDDLVLVLQLVACDAQEKRSKPNELSVITPGDIYNILDALGHGGVADDLLKHLKHQAGLLLEAVEEGPGVLVATYTKQFRFLHHTFQEYLAACELLFRTDPKRRRQVPVLSTRRFPEGLAGRMIAAPELWANVLRLGVDELLHQERPDDAWELLSLCCEPYLDRDEAAQAALLALQTALDASLLETRPERRMRAFYEDVRAAATKALIDVEHFPAPAQRDLAGQLLGSGPFPGHDTRTGVGLRPDGLPDIDWVPIPEVDPKTGRSQFIYQNGEKRVEPDFWIARYPITRAQFEAFLRTKDGFGNDEWWQGLMAPAEDRRKPGEQAFQFWNHPRERVSWYDAIAYCRWLTAKARQAPDLLPEALRGRPDWQITLPTEWQWEKAARGHDGRRYPWSDEYEIGYANIDERSSDAGPHYLQKTSAAGMYPQGESPYGVLDLSGNVWEWCLNEYAKPERIQEQGDAWRVLRGGSWSFVLDYAAAPARYLDYSPPNRSSYRGFRVVVLAASL